MKQISSKTRSRLIAISGILAFVSWVAARFGLESRDLSTSVRVALALLPVVPFAWFVWHFVRGAAELDELQKKIQLEALAIAFPLMLVFLMTIGLLDIAIGLPYENFGLKHLWYYMPVFYFTGLAIANRRYQ